MFLILTCLSEEEEMFYGETNLSPELNLPQSSSCVYICQYCLVHLGDIARYRNQRKQAENFYKYETTSLF
jgi:hypothetical protein